MADEVITGAGGGAGAATGGGTGTGGGASSGAPAASSALSDEAFLSQSHPAPAEGAEQAKEAPAAAADKPAEQQPEEINLAALEPGQPEWMAKVTDETAKAEIQKVLDFQKSVNAHFKDQAALDAFFKDLPGGVEQVAALHLLSKEIAEDDSAIEAGTPEGLAAVAEKYLGMGKDGGVGLFRSAAIHLAKTQPEAWAQLGGELVNETLKSSGIGADLATVSGAINEMRAAIAADDGEAFGRAAGKLLGQPKADPKSAADPRLDAAKRAEQDARASETKALGEIHSTRSARMVETFRSDINSQVAKIFSDQLKLPSSVSAETRTELTGKIFDEVIGQLRANAFLDSQITSLIGIGGGDFSKANLKASQKDFDTAVELLKGGANRDLVNRAVGKVVSAYAKERAASNGSARAAAKGQPERREVGAGPAVGTRGKPLTDDEMAKMSDEELLGTYTERRGGYA